MTTTVRILAILQDSTTRGANIIKQVLAFGRGIEGERVHIQVQNIIEDVGKIAKQTFPKNISIREELPKSLWPIKGDATQLHQVFLNLAINARDAMPEGGILTLKADNMVLDETFAQRNPDARPGPYVMVQVIDTGIGIPPGCLEKIFDPFFTTKAPGKGTGLGLSTTLGIVKSHSGFIQAISESGRGSIFCVYFAALQGDQTQNREIEELAAIHGNGQTVLVVEDEASVRDVVGRTLSANGYQVLTACDSSDAMTVFAQHRQRIQLVLTDLSMPLMDGPATIRAIRLLSPNLPIVLASGMLSSVQEADIKGQGIQGLLFKPFTTEKLLLAIHDALTASKTPG